MTNTALLEQSSATPKTPAPIVLRAAHDYTVTHQALEARAEDLEKLAKKNRDEGYLREARAVQSDAEAIKNHILPVFREQRELPLVTQDQLSKEISAALRIFVNRAFDGLGDPKVQPTPAGVAARRDSLLEALTKRVSMFVTDVADEAFNQGAAAREQTAEALAMRSISSLRASGE